MKYLRRILLIAVLPFFLPDSVAAQPPLEELSLGNKVFRFPKPARERPKPRTPSKPVRQSPKPPPPKQAMRKTPIGKREKQPALSAADYNKRGIDFYEKKDYDRAIREFTRAVKLDSQVPSFSTIAARRI